MPQWTAPGGAGGGKACRYPASNTGQPPATNPNAAAATVQAQGSQNGAGFALAPMAGDSSGFMALRFRQVLEQEAGSIV